MVFASSAAGVSRGCKTRVSRGDVVDEASNGEGRSGCCAVVSDGEYVFRSQAETDSRPVATKVDFWSVVCDRVLA